MSITNKPNAGEQIVELVIDPILGERYIPTQVFWNFLDEISVASDASTNATTAGANLAALTARVAQLEYELEDNPFTIDSTGWKVDTTRITVDMVKA